MVEDAVPIAFMHIPKTGGISFVRALRDVWEGRIADLYGASDADPLPVKRFLASADSRKIRLYAGHFSFGLHRWLPGRTCFYVSLLRDPTERILSLYRHSQMFRSRLRKALGVKGRSAKDRLQRILKPGAFPDFHLDYIDWIVGDDVLDAFLDSPSAELDNGMVRRFSGVGTKRGRCPADALQKAQENIETQFAVVGLVEEYGKTLEMLQATLKLPAIPVRYDNVGGGAKRPEKGVAAKTIAPEALARIRDMNQLDIALYEWTRKRFAKQSRKSCRRSTPVAARADGTGRRCPLWKSVGTLGLSSIVVSSASLSPVKSDWLRARQAAEAS